MAVKKVYNNREDWPKREKVETLNDDPFMDQMRKDLMDAGFRQVTAKDLDSPTQCPTSSFTKEEEFEAEQKRVEIQGKINNHLQEKMRDVFKSNKEGE